MAINIARMPGPGDCPPETEYFAIDFEYDSLQKLGDVDALVAYSINPFGLVDIIGALIAGGWVEAQAFSSGTLTRWADEITRELKRDREMALADEPELPL